MNRLFTNRNRARRRSPARSYVALLFLAVLTIISCIIVLLPPVLPLRTSSGQVENTTAAVILMAAATISLFTTTFFLYRPVLAAIAILLAVFGLYLASVVATHQQCQWSISGVPVAFILATFLVTMPGRKTPLQRVAGIGAVLVFLGILYMISFTGLWWQFLVLCIFIHILCVLFISHFIPFINIRMQLFRELNTVTTLAIVMALVIGFFNAAHFSQQFSILLPYPRVTLPITLLAIFISGLLRTHICIILWSCATAFLILVSLLFRAATLSTLLVAAFAVVLALMASWLGRISLYT